MPEFVYSAITKDGHHETSTIQAATIAAAGHLLKEQGLLPTLLEEKKTGGMQFDLSNFASISLNEKIAFIQNLSIMNKAGISVPRALQILAKQTKKVRFKNILTDVHAQVESGKSMAEAMEKYPKVFSNIFLSMIRVGELSGNLDQSLSYLATQLQREEELKSKTKGAMIYPSVIVGAMFIIGVLMSIFVLPKLTSTLSELGGGALPLQTRIVIAMSNFMSSHGTVVIVGLVAFVGLFWYWTTTNSGKRAVDFFLLHFYVINVIIKKINLARFSRILSSLLKSSIPIVEALQVASDSLGNSYYRDIAAKGSQDVRLGKPLSESLAKDPNLFAPLIIQMLQVGEESGTVENILEQLAVHYEEEVDNTLRNLSSIIEPLLLLVIGGVVGFLAFALIAPIYSVSQSIS